MANTFKILGQSLPASTANADLITVPAARNQIISTLVVANVTASAATCRIFARIAGAAAGTGNAIVYDVVIGGRDTVTFTLGITLNATDVLTVQSGTSSALTFTAFGNEIT